MSDIQKLYALVLNSSVVEINVTQDVIESRGHTLDHYYEVQTAVVGTVHPWEHLTPTYEIDDVRRVVRVGFVVEKKEWQIVLEDFRLTLADDATLWHEVMAYVNDGIVSDLLVSLSTVCREKDLQNVDLVHTFVTSHVPEFAETARIIMFLRDENFSRLRKLWAECVETGSLPTSAAVVHSRLLEVSYDAAKQAYTSWVDENKPKKKQS